MSDYITLLGSEDVRRAAREMQSAAEGMGRAAMDIEDITAYENPTKSKEIG